MVHIPAVYEVAAKIVCKVKIERGSLKQLVYETTHKDKKAILAISTITLRHLDEVNALIEKTKFLVDNTVTNPWLIRVFIAELLWGKKCLPDTTCPILTVLKYKEELERLKTDLFDTTTEATLVNKTRAVRVNTIQTSVESTINMFKKQGWTLIPFTGETYEDFLSQLKSLKEKDFMVDIHIKEILHFHHKVDLHKHPLYVNFSLILQDKASCLATSLLNPEPGSVVLDMCAAPGMKTTHLVALMNNQGTVYAVDRVPARFKILNKMITQSSATCVKTLCKDSLTVASTDCPSLKYILVDPSCTGTGISDRFDYNKVKTPSKNRLQQLCDFQFQLLCHALTDFPDVQRVVYSTCSIQHEENENVVQKVLKLNIDFKLVNAPSLLKGPWKKCVAKEEWKGITENCLSLKLEDDLTNGFFVAVFERFRKLDSCKTKIGVAKRKIGSVNCNNKVSDGANTTLIKVEEEDISPAKKAKNNSKRNNNYTTVTPEQKGNNSTLIEWVIPGNLNQEANSKTLPQSATTNTNTQRKKKVKNNASVHVLAAKTPKYNENTRRNKKKQKPKNRK